MALLILFNFLAISLALQSPGDTLVIPGWHLQSTSRVQGSLTHWSLPGADVSSWYRIGQRATVLAGLIESNAYNETHLFYSDRLSDLNKSDYQVPWLYREEFPLRPLAADQHLLLNLHGISSKADVFFNGVQIASNNIQRGSYAGHSYDLSAHIRPGPNALLIQAYPTNYLEDLALGWADWNPYPPDSGMGVWRSVDLKLTGPVSLSPPRVATTFAPTDSQRPLLVGVIVKTDVTNHGDLFQVVTIQGLIHLPGSPQIIELSQQAQLPPHSNSTVSLRTTLSGSQIQIWWPAAWGLQPLYRTQLNVSLPPAAVSDLTTPTNFGIRSVTFALNAHGDTQFTVNGRPFQVRGAGYAADIFLRFDIRRIETIFRYALDMGLNTIRLEGKQEHPELYDIADRIGLMLLPGWECCDKWEGWSYNEDAPGARWRDEDYPIGYASMLHETEMMQPHPSLLGFLIGSDYWPDGRASEAYLSALHRMDWPNPVIASASNRGHPTQLGPSGMKMEGPYDWVPPSYWYGNELGAAFGFGSEQSAGVGTPDLSSLRRFLSPSDLKSFWSTLDADQYHLSPGGSVFHNRKVYNNALTKRYGRPKSLEDYVFKAQVMDYEATRAEFEAFAARQNAIRPATGIIYWMLNSAWPSLHWQLFDYYLRPTGAYFGTKVGARQEHAVLDYGSRTVYIVNHSVQFRGVRRITMDIVDADGKMLLHREVTAETAPTTSREVITIPEIARLDNIGFLRLILSDDSKTALSRNVYWVSAQSDILNWNASNWYTTPVTSYADYTALSQMRPAAVRATASVIAQATPTLTRVEVRLDNEGDVPAFFLHLTVQGPNGEELTPVFWSDNYVTLFPREQLRLTVEIRPSQGWMITMSGGNVAERTIGRG